MKKARMITVQECANKNYSTGVYVNNYDDFDDMNNNNSTGVNDEYNNTLCDDDYDDICQIYQNWNERNVMVAHNSMSFEAKE